MLTQYFDRIKKSHIKDDLDLEIITVHEYPIALTIKILLTFLLSALLMGICVGLSAFFASDNVLWIATLVIALLFVGRCFVLFNRWFCVFYTITLDNIYSVKHRHIFARGGGEETLSLLYEAIGTPPEYEDRYLSFLHCGTVSIHTKNTDIVTGSPVVKKFGIVPKGFHLALLETMKSNKLHVAGSESHEERKLRAQEIREKQNTSKARISFITTIVHPYRQHHPLPLEVLLKQFNQTFHTRYTESDIVKAIHEWQAIGELPNVRIDGSALYLSNENFGDKQLRNIASKKKIAEKAMEYIHSGDIVAIDPGSTNLEIAKRICQEIPERFANLTIVTNSLPVANVFLNWIREKNSREGLLRVFIIEGRAIPDSLAVTYDSSMKVDGMNGFESLLRKIGKPADVAFIGTSGLFLNDGFAVDTDQEIRTKHDIWKCSRKRIVVMDASKFESTETRPFVKFSEEKGEIIVISCFEKEYAGQIETFKRDIHDRANMHLVLA